MPFCEFELMTYTYFRFVKWFFKHLQNSAYVVYMSATLAKLSLYSTLAISLHCCQFNFVRRSLYSYTKPVSYYMTMAIQKLRFFSILITHTRAMSMPTFLITLSY